MMIQDIAPLRFENQYRPYPPETDSLLAFVQDGKLLAKLENQAIHLPRYGEVEIQSFQWQYLFSIGNTAIFYPFGDSAQEAAAQLVAQNGFQFHAFTGAGFYTPKWMYFSAAVALHLVSWYQSNRFCGRCGSLTEHSERERAIVCAKCGRTIYPNIAPAVIIGVTSGDKILMSKYADQRDGTRYALLAGFCEIGETVEDTIRREVMEEVGLRIKGICYYGSQPWPFSGGLLMGFFCQADGDDPITIDKQELSEAGWVCRRDMDMEDDSISLTYEMMACFKDETRFKEMFGGEKVENRD